MRDDQTPWPRLCEHADEHESKRSGELAPDGVVASLDDRVMKLLDNALDTFLTSELVAIEIGMAKQRIVEWRRDARRYEVLTSLARDEYDALFNRSVGQGLSIHSLVDAIARQGVDDERVEFLKRQGYWADLVSDASE
ncbi:MAG TPA: hypothetical protein VL424_17140 [Pararobbsia sp.]|nr:hypothetical protein [Pararobbsia sp.]